MNRKKFPPDSNKLGNVLSLCGYFKSSLLNECRSIFEKNNNKVGLAVVLFTLGEKEQYNDDMSECSTVVYVHVVKYHWQSLSQFNSCCCNLLLLLQNAS